MRVPCALTRSGFKEAMLAVQAHPELDGIAVAGFLRDRGLSWQVRRDWSLDRTLQLQKVVLLNLRQLRKLGITYCRYLRKSEDLALCFQVAQSPGGHILKAHCYCYRALHLEQGGAAEVRHDCRRGVSSLEGLLLDGDMSPLSQVHHGDHDDMVSVAASDLQNGATRLPALSAAPPSKRSAEVRKVRSGMQLAFTASLERPAIFQKVGISAQLALPATLERPAKFRRVEGRNLARAEHGADKRRRQPPRYRGVLICTLSYNQTPWGSILSDLSDVATRTIV
eukprot:2899650-Amphidinium_carterae.3